MQQPWQLSGAHAEVAEPSQPASKSPVVTMPIQTTVLNPFKKLTSAAFFASVARTGEPKVPNRADGYDRFLSVGPSDERFVLKQPGLCPCQTAREPLLLLPYLQANRSRWIAPPKADPMRHPLRAGVGSCASKLVRESAAMPAGAQCAEDVSLLNEAVVARWKRNVVIRAAFTETGVLLQLD